MAEAGERGGLFWRRPVNEIVADGEARGYRRTLGPLDLASIGIAGIIGAGIFVVLGLVARDVAGPAVMLSVVLAGVAAVLTALTFAEFASMVPTSGGMYDYAYAALGRLPGFAIGWSVIMGYMVGNFAVAAGWSRFLTALVGWGAWDAGGALHTVPAAGGVVDLPAALAMAVVTLLCLLRVRESTRVNNVLVGVKVAVVLLVVGLGVFLIEPANWRPFAPYGTSGVMTAAAALLFAYFGFDTIAAAGAEAREPRRDLPFGIMLSVAIAGLLYVGMGAVVTGMRPIAALTGDAPLADAFRLEGFAWVSVVVSLGALVALTTVMYAYQLAIARIVQTMADDGFLPGFLGRVHATTGIPWPATLLTGAVMVVGAGFLDLQLAVAATVAASGTAYVFVAFGVLVLKWTRPGLARPFRVPAWVAVAAVAILLLILGTGLDVPVIAAYVAWLGLGLIVYGFYGHRRSVQRSLPFDVRATHGPVPVRGATE